MGLKLSIITPSYNQGDYIEQTIRSVVENQDYDNIEYIVIDGGSTDQTVDVLKKYDDKITYWVSEPDKGQTNAINKGVAKATGDIITWLCSDDYYEPNILGGVISRFKDNPEVNLICGNRRTFGYGIQDTIYQGLLIKPSIEENICSGQFDQPPSFFRKECWDEIFPLNESLHVFMDLEMWLRYLVFYGTRQVLHWNKQIANGRFHADSKSVTQTVECRKVRNAICCDLYEAIGIGKKLQSELKSIERSPYLGNWKIKQDFNKDRLESSIYNAFGQQFGDATFIYRDVASYFMYLGNSAAAIENTKMALNKDPLNIKNWRALLYAFRQKYL